MVRIIDTNTARNEIERGKCRQSREETSEREERQNEKKRQNTRCIYLNRSILSVLRSLSEREYLRKRLKTVLITSSNALKSVELFWTKLSGIMSNSKSWGEDVKGGENKSSQVKLSRVKRSCSTQWSEGSQWVGALCSRWQIIKKSDFQYL